jgi:hypothetical protein
MNREQKRKFKRERRTVTLHFPEDHDLGGLEVKIQTVDFETFMNLLELLAEVENINDIKQAAPALRELFEGFATALVEWNLVDENDQDVPATLDGLKSNVLDAQDIQILIGEWLSAIGGVYGPLGQTSADGKQSVDLASIPTETRSENLAS